MRRLYFDGSHGRFCFDSASYWLNGSFWTRLVFGIAPPLWWVLHAPRATASS